MKKYSPKLLIFLLGILVVACSSSKPIQHGGLDVWFENITYTFDLSLLSTQTPTARVHLDVDRWNGYYDPYLRGYQVFPRSDTMPAAEVIDQFKTGLETALDNVESKMEAHDKGTIRFGGLRFKGAQIDFHFEGDVRDMPAALGLVSHDSPTTMSLQQGILKVDMPLAHWKKNAWGVNVIYPGEVIKSNAPQHIEDQHKLIWTDKTVKDERIQFELQLN